VCFSLDLGTRKNTLKRSTAIPPKAYNPVLATGGLAGIPSTSSDENAARCANGAGLGQVALEGVGMQPDSQHSSG
jgi:hypothetical protein